MGNSPSSSAPINDGLPSAGASSTSITDGGGSSTESLDTTTPSDSRRQSVYTLATSSPHPIATPGGGSSAQIPSVSSSAPPSNGLPPPSAPIPLASSPPRRRASQKESPAHSPRTGRRISNAFSLFGGGSNSGAAGGAGATDVSRSPRSRASVSSKQPPPVLKTPVDEQAPPGSPFGKPASAPPKDAKNGLGITLDVRASPEPSAVVGKEQQGEGEKKVETSQRERPLSMSSTSSRPSSVHGDKGYKNSSKIVHAYGVGGIAPLAPLDKKKEEKKDSIPVMISWNGGGRTVYITGSFNNWKQKIRLTKSKADFTTVIDMPSNQTHRFKFIVDDEWKCSEDLPMASDPDGNLVNFLEVLDEKGEKMNDGLDILAKDMEDPSFLSPLSESPPSSYTSHIPDYLNWHLQPPPLQQPEPPPLPQEYPPLLPPHMERVLLNTANAAPSSQTNIGARDDNNELPTPGSVTLNHLYACSIRDGVMALASTSRYRQK
ncbi:Protein kinase, AMP-activated, beta, partial [Phlyctochytrium bullatum]